MVGNKYSIQVGDGDPEVLHYLNFDLGEICLRNMKS